jgi:hypothetical protein
MFVDELNTALEDVAPALVYPGEPIQVAMP